MSDARVTWAYELYRRFPDMAVPNWRSLGQPTTEPVEHHPLPAPRRLEWYYWAVTPQQWLDAHRGDR